MITKWFKSAMRNVLHTAGSSYGFAPIKNILGSTYYVSAFGSTPSVTSLQTGQDPGISVGTGNTAATDEDYNLESQIQTGISGTIVATKGMDENGNPYTLYRVTVRNTGNTDITIREIGFKWNLSCANTQGATSVSNRTCLMDRTVLSSPLTITAGGNGVINYQMTTDYDFT